MRKLSFTVGAILLAKTKSARFSESTSFPKPVSLRDTGHFHFRNRAEQLEAISKDPHYDLLIIGGGASGAGALLAASRKNFRALLIDANDFAAGTSSKSTKLLHGGLRYLENAFKLRNKNRREDFYLVNESLNERDVLLNNAPYLADQVGMVIPLTNIFSALYYYFGCIFYYQFAKVQRNGLRGLLSGAEEEKYPFQVSRPQLLTKSGVRAMIPNLGEKFKYGVLMFDGQSDDSSMVIDCILTATSLKDKALRQNEALNYVSLTSFVKDEKGKLIGAKLFDKIAEKEFEVRFKVAVNATGIFGDRVKQMANPEAQPRLLFAKGDHIALNNSHGQFLPVHQKNIGVFIPHTKDGRVMFVLPWQTTIIAGTTDKMVSQPIIHPTADVQSIREIMDTMQPYFPEAPYDITSKWSGIRPLVKDLENATPEQTPKAKDSLAPEPKVPTKDIKRVHVIDVDSKSGLITVYGGKLTIFRKMGEDAVNEAANELRLAGQISEETYQQSLQKSTENLRFIGDFRERTSTVQGQAKPEDKERRFSDRKAYNDFLRTYLEQRYVHTDSDIIEHLTKRYGHRAVFILDEMEKDLTNRIRLNAQKPYTKGEIEHIIRNEFVELPVDILVRRLRISFTESNLAKEILPQVIDIFGNLRGWDDAKKKKEYRLNLQILENMEFGE